MPVNPNVLNYKKLGCGECLHGAGLDFSFSMAFQPIINVNTKSVFAYEALVRGTNNESAGSILGRVDDTNRYRFDQACRVKAIQLASQLSMPTFLSINFLPNAVYSPETCIRTTLEAAEEFHFPKENLIFEVTEGEKITDHAHLKHILEEYKRQGFHSAIDDFGAGYSGLNLLAEFQPDIIKLDMLLLRDIDKDRVRKVIVQGILGVCRELNIKVIAEGIETKEEFEEMKRQGVELFQGYYFAKPGFEALPAVNWG